MAKVLKRTCAQVCACGCGRKFRPKVAWQLYVNLKHKNKAVQARWREKVKRLMTEAAMAGGQD